MLDYLSICLVNSCNVLPLPTYLSSLTRNVCFDTEVHQLTCLLVLICLAARLDTAVVDVGPPADWVKVNVQKTVSSVLKYNIIFIFNLLIAMKFFFLQKDCFEVYALVPGLLREEVLYILVVVSFFYVY